MIPAKSITEEEREKLIYRYGVPNYLPIVGGYSDPISLEQSMAKAGKYVIKQRRKGFDKSGDPNERPQDVYKGSFNVINRRRIKVENNEQQLSPEDAFWRHSNWLKEAKKEIKAIPFKDARDNLALEVKFMKIIDIKCALLINKDANPLKRSKNELNAEMRAFLEKSNEIKHQLFLEAMKENEFDFYKLPKKMQIEYAELKPHVTFPKKQDKKVFKSYDEYEREDLESRLLSSALLATQKFPETYQFSPNLFTKKGKDEVVDLAQYKIRAISDVLNQNVVSRRPIYVPSTQPVSPHHQKMSPIQLPKIKRPKTTLNTPHKSSIIKQGKIDDLWQLGDPLRREGSFVPISSTFSKYTDDIEISEYHTPSQEEILKEFGNPDFELPINHPDTESMDTEEDQPEESHLELSALPTSIPKPPVKEPIHFDPKIFSNVTSTGTSKGAIQYLIAQTANLEVNEGKKIHDELVEIWEGLGLSVTQKLEMVIKYSTSSEESSKLSEALSLWRRAKDVASVYKEVYKALKDYIRFEMTVRQRPDPPKSEIEEHDRKHKAKLVARQTMTSADAGFKGMRELDDHLKELVNAEASLQSTAFKIKETLGDDLVVDRKRVRDIIADRRAKVERMVQGLVV